MTVDTAIQQAKDLLKGNEKQGTFFCFQNWNECSQNYDIKWPNLSLETMNYLLNFMFGSRLIWKCGQKAETVKETYLGNFIFIKQWNSSKCLW